MSAPPTRTPRNERQAHAALHTQSSRVVEGRTFRHPAPQRRRKACARSSRPFWTRVLFFINQGE